MIRGYMRAATIIDRIIVATHKVLKRITCDEVEWFCVTVNHQLRFYTVIDSQLYKPMDYYNRHLARKYK